MIIIVVHFVMKLGALKFKFSSNDGDDDGGSTGVLRCLVL